MGKKVGIRELRKQALKYAAQMVRDSDFVEIFSADILVAMDEQEGLEELATQAQHEVTERIEKMAGE